jgi:hypothetical protein
LLIAVVGGVAWLGDATIQDAPLDLSCPPVTSAEKRRVVDVLRRSRDSADGIQRLHLEERDVAFLLAWAASLGPADGKTEMQMSDERCAVAVSVGIPTSGTRRYLNARMAGQMAIQSGNLTVRPEELQVGELNLPRPLLQITSWIGEATLRNHPDLNKAISSIASLTIDSRGIEIVARTGDDGLPFANDFMSSLLAQLQAKPDVVEAVRAQIRNLSTNSSPVTVDGDERFLYLLRSAFQFARERSAKTDPVTENRAAILTLGILLGHHRLESFVGPVTDNKSRALLRQHIRGVTLRGRDDWKRHFWVSASIALLSSEIVSDAVGLLKEELDAGYGGSGFSFADLAADRAGTLFAMAATRNRESACAMQERLASKLAIDDVFPPVDDLPEGVSDRDLESIYGGVGGRSYQGMMDRIEKRLAGCRLLWEK